MLLAVWAGSLSKQSLRVCLLVATTRPPDSLLPLSKCSSMIRSNLAAVISGLVLRLLPFTLPPSLASSSMGTTTGLCPHLTKTATAKLALSFLVTNPLHGLGVWPRMYR